MGPGQCLRPQIRPADAAVALVADTAALAAAPVLGKPPVKAHSLTYALRLTTVNPPEIERAKHPTAGW